MAQFRDQSWEQRFAALGDEAERVFCEVYPKGKARYGLDRPPIQLHKVPAKIRYTPDFITSDGLIEVQGLGRDRQFKLKNDKLAALHEWNRDFAVSMFVWDNVDRRWAIISLERLDDALMFEGEGDHFPEGKPYRRLHVDRLPATWTEVA